MSQWKVTGGSYDSERRGIFIVTKGSKCLDHREQDELEALLAGWQPIETAPQDDTRHIRGLWVRHAPKGVEPTYYWEAHIGHVTDEGCFDVAHGDDAGWEPDSYTHWMPEPKPAVPPPTN